MTDPAPSKEMTLEEALELCRKHAAWYPQAPSVSRTLVREIEHLRRENVRWENAHKILLSENERLRRPAHERESPHCSTCSCGMQPEPPGESRNVLPKITEEVVVLLWGSSLIESDYPGAPWSWSQCAVDFACLLNEGLAERRAAVTTEGGR